MVSPKPAHRNPRVAPALTIDGFLARCAAGPSTIAFYDDELRRFERKLGAPLGTAPTRALERLKADLRNSKSGPTRCRVLRQFYKAAGQEDRADIFRLRRKDSRLSPSEILTLPEINAMLDHARSLRNRAFIAVLWETGVRVSEVLNLDVRDVQEFVSKENGGRTFISIFFRKVKIKGEEHSSLMVEGGDHVRAWLNAYRPPSGDSPLFPSGRGDGIRLTRDGSEALIVKTAHRAGIEKRVYAHLFRHSRTTHLLRIGVPEAQVAKLLGWKSTRMLARYSHLVDRDAYASLLRAHGLEPPEPPKHERLLSAEGELRPVIPIVPAPGLRPQEEELLEGIGEDRLLELAAIVKRLREAKATSSPGNS